MRKEIQVIEHKGREIILIDFSNCQKEVIKSIIDDVKQWFQDKPPHSVLTLADVTDVRYDSEILNMFKEFTLYNKPFVKAGAVVGITRPLMRLAYNIVISSSGRALPIFDSREEAVEWLVKQ